jgi:hypothetical protein
MQVIKWFDESYWEQNIVLDKNSYSLISNWNIRDNSWDMSVYTITGTPLVVGKKLNINTDIFSDIHVEIKPQGRLIIVPVAKDVEFITRDNMGSEVELIFIGYDEVL